MSVLCVSRKLQLRQAQNESAKLKSMFMQLVLLLYVLGDLCSRMLLP